MNRCAIWAANAAVVWARQDDAREAEIQCILRKLRAQAAARVPGWTDQLRADNRSETLKHEWYYVY